MRQIILLAICTLVASLCVGPAWAQTAPPADTLKIDYFSNSNLGGYPDGTFRISNPGTYPGGNLCANIFVYDKNEELTECCSCIVTPDDLRIISVNYNLTLNPTTGNFLHTGVVKLVSTKPVNGACQTYPYAWSTMIVPGLRAWMTHIQSTTQITEGESQDATLSTAEVGRLEAECKAIFLVGSGQGLCQCGTNGE